MTVMLKTLSWTGIAQSVLRLATGRTFRGSNWDVDEIFRTDPVANPASYMVGSVSFSAVNLLEGGVNNPPPSSSEVKERGHLYTYSLSMPS